MKRRKAPKHVYAIIFHGLYSSNLTLDMRPMWATKKGARKAIANSTNRESLEAVKYVRAK
jgi:hypothetical protein